MNTFHRLQRDLSENADVQRFFNRVNNPFLKRKEENLAYLIARHMPADGTSLLEIGCGEGSNFCYMSELLPETKMVGMDFSFGKLRFLRDHLQQVRAVCGNAIELPFCESMFDIVLCRDLLHHVNWARGRVMEEAVRVVKPGRKVVVIEASGRAFLNRIFRLHPAERGLKDSYPESLRRLGEKYGETELEFIEASILVRATAFPFGWPQGWRRHFLSPVYWLARLWEIVYECMASKSRWSYMMLSVKRG